MKSGVTGILRVAQQNQSLNEIKTLVDGLLMEIDAEDLDVNDFRDKVEQVAAELASAHDIETEEKASTKDLEQSAAPEGEGEPSGDEGKAAKGKKAA